MTDKLNVLQVIPQFGIAGAEIMCEALSKQIKRSENYNVYVASLFDHNSYITKRLEAEGVEIIYLGKKKGLDFSIINKLYKLMKSKHIDVVHTHLYVMQYAIPAAIMAGVSLRVHTVHNIADKEFSRSKQILSKIFYHFCKVIPVGISPVIQDSIVALYHLRKEDVPMVYNGIDLSSCIVKDQYVVHGVFEIVHIGRFSYQKNHITIVNAIKQLKDKGYNVHINLIGGAGNEEEIKELVSMLQLNNEITFCGIKDNIYPYLANADAFILPSNYEGMPISLIEAMGSGLPIIASNVGGIPDMIESDISGLLINPDVDSLVLAISRLIDDEYLRKKIGRGALIRSKEFDSSTMYSGYEKLYAKLCN